MGRPIPFPGCLLVFVLQWQLGQKKYQNTIHDGAFVEQEQQ
jgi:hypothetical protein